MQGAARPHWEQIMVQFLAEGHDDGQEGAGFEPQTLWSVNNSLYHLSPNVFGRKKHKLNFSILTDTRQMRKLICRLPVVQRKTKLW